MPEMIDFYIDQELDHVRNQTFDEIMALPQGQQVADFLNNTELKDAVRSTVDDSLSSLVDESSLTGIDAAIWEITQTGFDEFLNATTAEEAAQIDTIDGLVSIQGDTAEVLLDAFAEILEQEIDSRPLIGGTDEVPLPGINTPIEPLPVWEPEPIT